MVLLAASLTLWSNQCLCKSVCVSDIGTTGSHSFLCLFPCSSTSSPRNERAPTHSCHWPGWPHRETESQRRPPLFPGVWGKSRALILYGFLPPFQTWEFVSLLCVWETHYASLIPYACILMDYWRLLSQTYFSHFYNSITNPTRKPTLILNATRCFFTKLAGGVLLKQSVCALMFPRRMLFCRQSLRCNLVRDYLLSVFTLKKKKGSKFAFKVAHSWFGVYVCGQMRRRGIRDYRKMRPFIYLFLVFDLFYLISFISHIDRSNKAVEPLLYFRHNLKGYIIASVCVSVTSICCYSMKFAVQFHTPERNSKFILVTSWPFPKHHHKPKLKPTFYNCSVICPVQCLLWK